MSGLLQLFTVDVGVLRNVAQFMDSEMTQGLTHAGSSMYMIPTYVTKQRSLHETGCFIGLDFGGTNFRVVFCDLQVRGAMERVCGSVTASASFGGWAEMQP